MLTLKKKRERKITNQKANRVTSTQEVAEIK